MGMIKSKALLEAEDVIAHWGPFMDYWDSLGKPPLEYRFVQDANRLVSEWLAFNPEDYKRWPPGCDFRIAGDEHWQLRLDWVNSDFNLPIEALDKMSMCWCLLSTAPHWHRGSKYRRAVNGIVSDLEKKADTVDTEIGDKFDSEKPDWTLIPFSAFLPVVKVMEFGAKKYSRDNWQKVKGHRRRYLAAAMRHLFAVSDGEWLDQESKLPHLAHAACCILFLLWFGESDDKK